MKGNLFIPPTLSIIYICYLRNRFYFSICPYADVLLHLLRQYPNLATLEGSSVLSNLVETPSNFLSGSRLGFWESLIHSRGILVSKFLLFYRVYFLVFWKNVFKFVLSGFAVLPIWKSNTLPYSVTVIVDDSRDALGSSQEYGYFRHGKGKSTKVFVTYFFEFKLLEKN